MWTSTPPCHFWRVRFF